MKHLFIALTFSGIVGISSSTAFASLPGDVIRLDRGLTSLSEFDLDLNQMVAQCNRGFGPPVRSYYRGGGGVQIRIGSGYPGYYRGYGGYRGVPYRYSPPVYGPAVYGPYRRGYRGSGVGLYLNF